MSRYQRQISVLGVGELGQARLARASVVVCGSGVDAEVCARYLAGAGVGHLSVERAMMAACAELNREVEVTPVAPLGRLEVRVGAAVHRPLAKEPILRGALAARWALAQVLFPEGT